MDDEGETGSLCDAMARSAIELAAVTTAAQGGALLYLRSGIPFALVADDALEVRLHPDIAAAALRTQDTTASEREIGWVRFAPSRIDRYSLDRATAWFLSAWRAAGPRQ